MTIQRYEPYFENPNLSPKIIKCELGRFVLYSDHLAEVDRAVLAERQRCVEVIAKDKAFGREQAVLKIWLELYSRLVSVEANTKESNREEE